MGEPNRAPYNNSMQLTALRAQLMLSVRPQGAHGTGRMTGTEYPVSFNPLPLDTRSLLIRQVVLDDARDLLVLSNEQMFRAWLPSQVYSDESHARSALEFLIGQYSTPANPRQGAYVLVIEHKADRTLIGHVGLSPIDDDVEIGFAIAQRYQGHGLAVEAIVAASRWAFETFGLDRILSITSSANIASKRALVRAEFAHQGDKVMRFQGTEQSVSVYALSALSGPEVGA